MRNACSGIVQDLRGGLRILRHHPYLAMTAISTLGLGIGVATAVFSWVDAVLLHPIPGAHDPDRLVSVEAVPSTGQTLSCAYPDYRDFQKGADLLSGLAAWHLGSFTIGEGRGARRVYGQIVSANFFSVLGVKPSAGRVFTLDEDRDVRAGYPYAVIGDRLWRTAFQGDPGVLGKAVRINGRPTTIIGVAPPDFRGAITGLSLDLWVHLSMIGDMGGSGSWPVEDRNSKPLVLIGRLRPGVSVEQANAQVAAVARRIAAAHPATHAGTTAAALPLWKSHAGVQDALRSPLRILLAISVLVLLIACANVANLLLARSVSRQSEFGTRLALGASRIRIVRQALVESVVVAAPAVAAGLLVALWLGQCLALLVPPTDLPLSRFVDIQLSGRVLGFASAACVIAALLSGIAPALYSSRANLNVALQDRTRSSTGAARSRRARGLLVAAEVALATIATIGAGLFARSFEKVGAIRLGFDPERVQIAQLFLASAGYSADQEKRFCQALRRRLENERAIEGASYSIELPLAQAGDEALEVEGYTSRAGESVVIPRNNVGPDYFRLLRIPITAGREFNERDDEKGPPVAIVNETFAHRYFPGTDPVGRRFRFATEKTWTTIVGVAKDSKYASPMEGPRPYFYRPFQQTFASGHYNYFLVRSSESGAAALDALRRGIASLDSTGELYHVQPLDQHIRVSLYTHYIAASLMGAMGALSIFLTALGIYSVTAYAVNERRQEIGIRMALGARPGEVQAMVVRQAIRMTAPGILAGFLAALGASRVIAGMLVGVGASDPLSFAFAALIVVSVAVVASWIAALRSTRIDPAGALRFE